MPSHSSRTERKSKALQSVMLSLVEDEVTDSFEHTQKISLWPVCTIVYSEPFMIGEKSSPQQYITRIPTISDLESKCKVRDFNKGKQGEIL